MSEPNAADQAALELDGLVAEIQAKILEAKALADHWGHYYGLELENLYASYIPRSTEREGQWSTMKNLDTSDGGSESSDEDLSGWNSSACSF